MSMAKTQRLAAQCVASVQQGRNLSDVLAALWQQHQDLSAQERGAIQALSYGCLRFSGSLKALLAAMLNKPLKDETLKALLLVALYQLVYEGDKAHAVVHEAVKAAAKVGKGQFKGLTNALLRRFLREREALWAEARASDEGRYNLPAWWLTRLRQDYPDAWQEIAEAFMQRPPMTLRINQRRTDAEDYLKTLQAVGLDGKVLGDYALQLAQPVAVSALPGFAQGCVSVQDWGAQQAACWLDVQDGERVLDACAAPGGKSGHILEWADCALTCLDIDASRLARVDENLARLQLNAQTVVANAEQWASCYDGALFDAILADVPCTATGVVRRHPDIKWLRREGDAVKTAAQQEVLLAALWRILRAGGRMLFATCSLFPEENEQQLQKFLSQHPDAACRRTETLLPNTQQDGFFYALIDKNG